MTIKIVTGFVPLPGHPRSEEEYIELGDRLLELDVPATLATMKLEQCWMYQFLHWQDVNITWACADNPKKNTLGYHCVQHMKTAWMLAAAVHDPEPDVFVWIDYGIMGVPGVSRETILDFLPRAAREKTISIPGCWPQVSRWKEKEVCWRFCGGVIVAHRSWLYHLDAAVRAEALAFWRRRYYVTFEVNTWARVEQKRLLPITWYQADHNEKMFTAYPH
jgi:hypothetical protein